VDYILFLTADVTVTPNLNEIRDYKYVSKHELQAMFDDPGKGSHNLSLNILRPNRCSQFIHSVV
jgi:isopentenyldiphosphate isomerase